MGSAFRLGLLQSVCFFCASACSRSPNVVLITLDTTRADHLGAYGSSLAQTPTVDALAQSGVRFEHAFAPAPITAPSHASILTGRYPPAHGVRDNGSFRLPDAIVTLPERLRDRGYATAAFVSAAVLDHRYNLSQGFDHYDDALAGEDDPKMFMVRERPGRRTVDAALDWLAHRPRGPFMLWLHLYDPHEPHKADLRDSLRAPSPYAAEIAGADRQVGRVMKALAAQGADDNTLVIVTADHGESLGEHGEKTHAIFVYGATIAVPLIIRFPGAKHAGVVVPQNVSTVDITPTVLATLGLPPEPQVQGLDLSPLIGHPELADDRVAYSESKVSELGFGMAPLFALRVGPYTYVNAPRRELYDRTTDPAEMVNLYDKDRPRADRMQKLLEQTIARAESSLAHAEKLQVGEETLEMLRALGYVGDPAAKDVTQGVDPKDGIADYQTMEDARHAAQRGDFAMTAQLAERILARQPLHISALNILGLARSRLLEPSLAMDAYVRSLSVMSAQPRVYLAMAGLEARAQRTDRARAALQGALAADPHFVEAMDHLAVLEATEGNMAKSREWLVRAIATDPFHPRAMQLAGDWYALAGDPVMALGYYERALEWKPRDFAILNQAGVTALAIPSYASAGLYFTLAQAVDPKSWQPLYNMACMYAQLGDPNAAFAALEQALARGFSGRRKLQLDPDLFPLRADPRFASLLAKTRIEDIDE